MPDSMADIEKFIVELQEDRLRQAIAIGGLRHRLYVWKRAAKENRAFYQLTLGTAKSNQLKWHAAEATATRHSEAETRLRGLLERANMALLMYTQSHGTPPGTQLLGELAEALGLDANGKPLDLVEELAERQADEYNEAEGEHHSLEDFEDD